MAGTKHGARQERSFRVVGLWAAEATGNRGCTGKHSGHSWATADRTTHRGRAKLTTPSCGEQQMGAPLVDKDWHVVCQAICRDVEGVLVPQAGVDE